MIADASLVVKSYIPEQSRKRICARSTQELHTKAEPEAGMHLEHPGATYQSKAGSRYALRAPKSCIHMHPKNLPDAYRKKGLKAVHKRFYTEGTTAYAAKGEEASDMRQQQECILNGGVYLRHRLKDNFLPFLRPKYSTTARGVQHRRSGVLACKKLSLDSTRHGETG